MQHCVLWLIANITGTISGKEMKRLTIYIMCGTLTFM